MYLSLGYLDGATNFAQSCGDTSLPWGHKEGEDDRRFAYRCMMQAHKVLDYSKLQAATEYILFQAENGKNNFHIDNLDDIKRMAQ